MTPCTALGPAQLDTPLFLCTIQWPESIRHDISVSIKYLSSDSTVEAWRRS